MQHNIPTPALKNNSPIPSTTDQIEPPTRKLRNKGAGLDFCKLAPFSQFRTISTVLSPHLHSSAESQVAYILLLEA
jgi:hypothetical protein